VNLHIFAEPLTEEILKHEHHGKTHLEEAFGDLVSVFRGLDLTMSGKGVPVSANPIKDIGLPEDEQITMTERTVPCDSEHFGDSDCPPFVVDNTGN
jgi:hypothetical protein